MLGVLCLLLAWFLPELPPGGRPVAGQLSRLSVNLPALLLKVLLHKAALPGQNGSPLT